MQDWVFFLVFFSLLLCGSRNIDYLPPSKQDILILKHISYKVSIDKHDQGYIITGKKRKALVGYSCWMLGLNIIYTQFVQIDKYILK